MTMGFQRKGLEIVLAGILLATTPLHVEARFPQKIQTRQEDNSLKGYEQRYNTFNDIETLQNSLSKNPSASGFVHLTNLIYSNKSKFPKTIDFRVLYFRAAEHAYQIDPHDFNAVMVYANAFSLLGDFIKAKSKYDEAKKISPDNPMLFYQMGRMYLSANEPENAVRQFNTSLKLDPRNQLYTQWYHHATKLISR